MSFTSEAESSGSVACKDFISENEIEERRQRRQEEWEKVRKPEDPEEVPEEEYDPRSLYDRLQEQKDKKQAEYEESHRLKNLIKGLDDDEVAFLELVDKTKMEMETKMLNDEMKELQEFKKAVAHLSEEESEAKIKELRKSLKLPSQSSGRKSQQDLLSSAVKRKVTNGSVVAEKKQCTTFAEGNGVSVASDEGEKPPAESPTSPLKAPKNNGTLQCLGILPGLGAYTDSSDSDNSSNSENEKDSDFDLIGRKRICVKAAKSQS